MEDKKEIIKKYSNGEVSVVWEPEKCTHACSCWMELPEVFDPKKRPWININGADTERIIKQVERCPSGALTYYTIQDKSSEINKKEMETRDEKTSKVVIHHGGPLFIEDCVEVTKGDGSSEKKCGGTAFCRCGGSKNQPYCDGTHMSLKFDK